ncbi:MAG: hypothetical protein QM237_01500 [Bacteroidota bacterium]|nr:hypothetical protein [Bacteroidota bacterium]
MKQIFTIITLLAMIIFAGCTDLDDIYSRLDDQREELANIKSLANAMANKLSVVSYKELDDRSGYELTMSNGSKIILKHGNKGPEGDQGSQGEQGEPGAPGQDGDANLTITETADGIIIEYKGESYILPKFPTMTLTTAKSVEETIGLWIDAAEADRPGVWIDLNNNGEKDDGEAVTKFRKFVGYTLGAQTVTVYGKVTVLNCENNQLTSLNVSNNTVLTFLDCSSNQLSSLEVSNNKKLEKLYCRSNQLTSLDISNNKELEILWCNNNQLTTLNVSNNVKLWFLSCHDNQLTSLDVSKNTLFEQLFCYNNKISGANMTALVNSLPDRNDKEEGKFGVFDIESDTEQNVITAAQAAVATGKNWIVQDSDGNPYTPGS